MYGFDTLTHAKSMFVSPPDVAIDQSIAAVHRREKRGVADVVRVLNLKPGIHFGAFLITKSFHSPIRTQFRKIDERRCPQGRNTTRLMRR